MKKIRESIAQGTFRELKEAWLGKGPEKQGITS
jgi:queuine/archaeosine tRNA-ribosyltransferase